MRDKYLQACEEELIRGIISEEEFIERCLKLGISRDLIDKLLKEHREAIDRMVGEGNPWG